MYTIIEYTLSARIISILNEISDKINSKSIIIIENDSSINKTDLARISKKNLDESVEKISEVLFKYRKVRLVPNYGELTREKIKKILTDENERKKFLVTIGFPKSYAELEKDLAERVLKGELTIKDAFYYLINQSVKHISELLGHYGAEKQKQAFLRSIIGSIIFGLFVIFIGLVKSLLSVGLTNYALVGYVLYIVILPAFTELFAYILSKLKLNSFAIISTSLYSSGFSATIAFAITHNPIFAFIVFFLSSIINILISIRTQKILILQKVGFNVEHNLKILAKNIVLRILTNFITIAGASAFSFFANLIKHGLSTEVIKQTIASIFHIKIS